MGRRKTYERSEVLENALGLFWRKGYEGSHLQELVEVTGLNRFGLYKEFGGKEGLFAEAMDLYLEKLGGYAEPLTRSPHGMNNVRAYFAELDMGFFQHGCFLTNSLTEKNVINPTTYGTMVSAFEAFQDLLMKNLKAARKNGDIRSGVVLEDLHHFLSAMDLGIPVYSINSSPKDQARVVSLLNHFLNSLK